MDYGGYTIWCGSHDCEQVERNAFLKIMYLVGKIARPRNSRIRGLSPRATPAGFDTGTYPARLF